MQYYYLVGHHSNDEFIVDKIFITSDSATKWGRKKATQYPETTYSLFRQPMTSTGIISFYKQLKSYGQNI